MHIWVAQIDPKSSCRLIMGNHLCNLSPIINIEDCKSGETLTINVESKDLFGAHSRHKESSVRQAASKFNRSLFKEDLLEILVYNIPIKLPESK